MSFGALNINIALQISNKILFEEPFGDALRIDSLSSVGQKAIVQLIWPLNYYVLIDLFLLLFMSRIDTSCLDIPYLARLMRMLVCKGIFAVHHSSNDSDETLYKMTHISKWLLHNSYLSVAPMILELWHYLRQCVKERGIALKKAHGCKI